MISTSGATEQKNIHHTDILILLKPFLLFFFKRKNEIYILANSFFYFKHFYCFDDKAYFVSLYMQVNAFQYISHFDNLG